MKRPPIWRWFGAAVLVVVGLYGEYRPEAVSSHPYLMADVPAGVTIDEVEWRQIPAGVLPSVDGLPFVARIDLPAGTPLTPAVLGEVLAPDGWWSLPVELPSFLSPGTRLVLLVDQHGEPVESLVLAATPDDDGFGPPTGLIAVAPEDATSVARANISGSLIVLIVPG